ncbi:hypothetical protein WUBG_04520, partial [Wuchereria bancrofti]
YLLIVVSLPVVGKFSTLAGVLQFVNKEYVHCLIFLAFINFRYCYIGSGDSYLEVFKTKEYGNLLERIKTDHPFGVDSVQLLRPGVLLTGSNEDDQLRLLVTFLLCI